MSNCNEAPLDSKYCYQRTQPTSKCGCPNPTNYKKNARGRSKFRKGRYEYKQKGSNKDGSTTVWYYAMPFGAHHVIPIHAAKILPTHDSQVVQDATKQVEWCVNAKPNMLALPLWGHIVKHYCHLALGSAITQQNLLKDKDSAPPFADLPMHDVDHDKFTDDAAKKMRKIADGISKNAKACEVESADIVTELKNLSKKLDKNLHKYGERQGGTHAAWQMGIDDEDDTSKWYEAFSMAKDARKRSFPCRSSGKAWERIQKLAKAFVA